MFILLYGFAKLALCVTCIIDDFCTTCIICYFASSREALQFRLPGEEGSVY